MRAYEHSIDVKSAKYINNCKTVRIHINLKYIKHRYQEAQYSSNRQSAASHWCEKADLMMADEKRPIEAVLGLQ
jgi:hypothetical protein